MCFLKVKYECDVALYYDWVLVWRRVISLAFSFSQFSKSFVSLLHAPVVAVERLLFHSFGPLPLEESQLETKDKKCLLVDNINNYDVIKENVIKSQRRICWTIFLAQTAHLVKGIDEQQQQ